MTHEEKAEAGGRFIYGDNWERVKAEETAREKELAIKEQEYGAMPPPLDPSPPPRVKQIRGSVNKDEPDLCATGEESRPWTTFAAPGPNLTTTSV